MTLSGTIYEDVNGDASLADGVGVAGASVHLYQDNAPTNIPGAEDTLYRTATTGPGGTYSFSGVPDGNYWVAVDSTTITPAAPLLGGHAVGETWAEQTWAPKGGVRYRDGAWWFHQDPGEMYGGLRWMISDGSASFASREHIARMEIIGGAPAPGLSLTGLDFGFSFNVVTRTGDGDDHAAARTVQGSLRQAIQNGNALQGTQSPLFRMSTRDTGYSGGVWTTNLTSTLLDPVTDPLVLDATTQAGYAGDPGGGGERRRGGRRRPQLLHPGGGQLHAARLRHQPLLRRRHRDRDRPAATWSRPTSSAPTPPGPSPGPTATASRSSPTATASGGRRPARAISSRATPTGAWPCTTPPWATGWSGQPDRRFGHGRGPGERRQRRGDLRGRGRNTVGGVGAAAQANVIAHNGGAGVMLLADAGSSNLSPATRSTATPAWASTWRPAGVTANDAGDGDTGPNGLQNFPLVTSAVLRGANIVVSGTLSSTPGTTFTIDLYSSADKDPDGYGEGATYLGSTTVTTNGSGTGAFTATLAAGATLPGWAVSATATSPSGSTSEFASNAEAVEFQGMMVWRTSGDTSPNFRIWDGAAFGPAGNSSAVGELSSLRAAESPTRDEIIVIGRTAAGSIVGEIWDGTSWSALPGNPLGT